MGPWSPITRLAPSTNWGRHGKISSDVRYSRGRVILDFKLTEYKRPSQQNGFIKFAIKNGYTVVYVYGKI
jgi:hypothetical protein